LDYTWDPKYEEHQIQGHSLKPLPDHLLQAFYELTLPRKSRDKRDKDDTDIDAHRLMKSGASQLGTSVSL
jgi:hypothetical protein